MTRFRAAAFAILIAGLLATTGCSTSKPGADIELTVNPDGTIEQSVAVRGLDLTSSQLDAMRAAKWTVHSSSSQADMNRTFTGLGDFGDNGSAMVRTLYSALGTSLDRDLPSTGPQVLTLTKTELFVAERYAATYELPELDLKPTKCSACSGLGRTNCYSCSGTGRVECDNCGGSGESGWDYWSQQPYTCSYCNGSGRVTCSNCDGNGKLDCSQCDGTGKPSDSEIENYDSAVSNARVSVALNMPGVGVQAKGSDTGASWNFESEDALSGVKVSATSWVVDWLVAGLAAAALLVVLLLVIFLIVRKIKRSFARRAERSRVAAAVVPGYVTPTPGSPAAGANGDVRYCPGCGKPNAKSAQFCSGCGRKF